MNAFRSGHLVYIPITKIASSSFTYLFGEMLGWEPMQVDQIDWEQDRAFAHIMNPIVRHAKGTAECIIQYGMLDVVDDPKFQKLLATCVFDIHSYPIVQCFGEDQCRKIDWIPIDLNEVNGNTLTARFLKYHGVNLDLNDLPMLYTSADSLLGDEKQSLSNQILKLHKEYDVNNTLSYFYDRDIVLYNQVRAKIKPWMNAWNEISWLNHEHS